MRISRIEQLEQYILEHKSASIDTLCELFQISKKHAAPGSGGACGKRNCGKSIWRRDCL